MPGQQVDTCFAVDFEAVVVVVAAADESESAVEGHERPSEPFAMAGSEPQQPTRTERWAGPIEKRQTATETQKTLALLLASRNKKRNTLFFFQGKCSANRFCRPADQN